MTTGISISGLVLPKGRSNTYNIAQQVSSLNNRWVNASASYDGLNTMTIQYQSLGSDQVLPSELDLTKIVTKGGLRASTLHPLGIHAFHAKTPQDP